MKCQARINRIYKTRKAAVVWPETVFGPNADIEDYPEVCGGDVTVTIRAVDEPDWGSSYARLTLDAVCTRCDYPWWPGRIALEGRVDADRALDITALLEEVKLGA
jgi:hypothetical protein